MVLITGMSVLFVCDCMDAALGDFLAKCICMVALRERLPFCIAAFAWTSSLPVTGLASLLNLFRLIGLSASVQSGNGQRIGDVVHKHIGIAADCHKMDTSPVHILVITARLRCIHPPSGVVAESLRSSRRSILL